jgi:hypothetical protein
VFLKRVPVAGTDHHFNEGFLMATKTKLHPRNQHREDYDFARLMAHSPELETFMISNPLGLFLIRQLGYFFNIQWFCLVLIVSTVPLQTGDH